MKILSYLLLAVLFFFSCSKKQSVFSGHQKMGTVELVIVPYVGDKPLYLDSIYQNQLGEKYSLKTLKFFLSQISFAHSSGKEFSSFSESNRMEIYFMNFNASNFDAGYGKQSYEVVFKAVEGEYSDIRFNIGVPREVNHADPATAPSPLNSAQGDEMYWEWNSGYIFFLSEGTVYNDRKDLSHFAIGNDSRIMPLSFGNLFDVVPLVKIQEGKTTRIKFSLDFNKLFENGDKTFYSFNVKDQAIVHGGYNADILRNNLINSFRFIDSKILE